jgi:hypothetical protein
VLARVPDELPGLFGASGTLAAPADLDPPASERRRLTREAQARDVLRGEVTRAIASWPPP